MQFLREDTAATIVIGPFLDKTDGVTPEEGIDFNTNVGVYIYKGSAETQISSGMGGAGANEIIHKQDGFYTMILTTGNLDTAGRFKITFSDESDILPVWHEYVVLPQAIYDWFIVNTASEADLTIIKNRLGSWTGSGVNSILGAMKALMDKGSGAPNATPSDIGVGFDSSTDSLEALFERLAAMAGAGFSSASHSLKIIAQLLSGTLAGGAVSGGATSSTITRAGGFLRRIINIVRKAVDQPAYNAKYQDTDLIEMMTVQWPLLWTDFKLTAEDYPIVRYDIEVVADVQEYFLPPSVGEIVRVYKVEESSGLPQWEIAGSSFFNPAGPGWTIEGNILRLTPKWKQGETLRIEYIPSGEVSPHEGVGTMPSTTTLLMGFDQLVAGTMDRRANAYAGYMLRVFGSSSSPVEVLERVVSASSGLTLTFAPIAGEVWEGDLDYELVPVFAKQTEGVLGLKLARRILSQEGDSDRYKLITQEFVEAMRNARLSLINAQSRRASHLEGDTIDNPRYRGRHHRLQTDE